MRLLTGEREIRLTRAVPSTDQLREKFTQIDALGLYLHIPFCERICPYCPYNRELYSSDLAEVYVWVITREIDIYGDRRRQAGHLALHRGGTPTPMLHDGLADIIGHVTCRNRAAAGAQTLEILTTQEYTLRGSGVHARWDVCLRPMERLGGMP